MTLGKMQDLDELLRSWPAPAPGKGDGVFEPEENADWAARSDAIVKAAIAAGPAKDARALAQMLEAPQLEPEPGEPPVASAPGSVPTTERKRSSLKELAERASQAGAGKMPSIAPGAGRSALSTPLPATSTPLPSRPALSSRPPLSHDVDKHEENSGIVDLNIVSTAATAQQAANEAQPESTEISGDESKPASEVRESQKAKVASISEARAKKGSNTGMLAGGIIAVLGIAAAFAIVQRNKVVPPASEPAVVAEADHKVASPPMPAAATGSPETKPAPSSGAIAINDLDEKGNEEPKPGAEPGNAASAPAGGAVASAPTAALASKEPAGSGPLAAAKPGSASGGKPGDLASEMARAVGTDAPKQPDNEEVPQPAAGNPRNQNIPEQPSQGSVQSAIGAVLGAAKACVTSADDVSRAQVTFASNGTVSSVSVTGWAASNGASGCIKAALKGAKVGPFSRSSYTFGVTIRP